ncbi:MAG: cell wall hydrolase [Bacillota bacterium]
MRKISHICILTALFILVMATGAYAAVTHTVQRGESLYLISVKTEVSPLDIMKANKLKSNTIHPGQKLTIPSRAAKSSSVRYIVKKGDNLTRIAKKYGTTVKAIQTANKLKGSKIRVGQALAIPVKAKTAAGTTMAGNSAPKKTASSQAPKSSSASSPAAGNSTPGYKAASIDQADNPKAIEANTAGSPLSGNAVSGETIPGDTTPGDSGTDNPQVGNSDPTLDPTTDSSIAAGKDTTDSQAAGDTSTVPAPDNSSESSPAAGSPDTGGKLASRGGDEASRLPISQADLDLLAHLIYGEARGESYNGQVAVAAVALNRLKAPGFPKTLKEVIYQPWAFTSINDGQFNLTPDATTYRAALDALNGVDPTNGALYFWNPVTSTSKWILTRSVTSTIGNHNFGI